MAFLETTTVIAELGVNHEGSKSIGYQLIDEAIQYGFDAIKVQHIDPKRIWHESYPYNILSEKESLSDLFLKELTSYSHDHDIIVGCTPTFQGSSQIIKDAGCDFIKVASPQAKYDWFILDEALATGLPLIISNGHCNTDESLSLIDYISSFSRHQPLAFLFCVAQYPSDSVSIDWSEVSQLSNACQQNSILFGFSDHYQSIYPSLCMKHNYNATVFEKHFCLPTTSSLDRDASIYASQALEYVRQLKMPIERSPVDRSTLLLDKSHIYTSSFYLKKDVKRGELFSLSDFMRLRDGMTCGVDSCSHWHKRITNESLTYALDLPESHRLSQGDLV